MYRFPTAKGTTFLPQPSDRLILAIGPRLEGHCPNFAPSRRTSPIVFASPSISSAYAGTGLGRGSSIRLKIFRNRSLDTATSANWNVTYRPWRTTLTPILTSLSRSVVNDHICEKGGMSALGHLRTSRAARLNVCFGSKADIPRPSHLCPLSGVKPTSDVRFLSPKLCSATNVCFRG